MIETANDNAVFERTAIVNDGSDRTIDLVQASDGAGGAGTPQIQNRYTHGGQVDEPLSLEVFTADGTLDQAYTYHADHLGSIRFITDSVGTIVNAYEYDSYGRPGFELEQVAQPFRYTGREWDQATELYHYRARQYDPETGRFLQEDPIGFAAGDLNLQRYVGSNPIMFGDPTGLFMDTTGQYTKAKIRASPGTAAAEYTGLAANALNASASIGMVGCGVNSLFTGVASAVIGANTGQYMGMSQAGLCTRTAEFKPAVEFQPGLEVDGFIGLSRPGIDGVHGNSRRSPNPTWVYYLVDNNSVIQKIGISSNPDKRYTQTYLIAEGVTMRRVFRYNQRAPALAHEKMELTYFYIQTGRLPRLNRRFR